MIAWFKSFARAWVHGAELARDGFYFSNQRCTICHTRSLLERGDEYWCIHCGWGVIHPETEAAHPRIWPHGEGGGMRKGIEKLARELDLAHDRIGAKSLGEVAELYGESVERIMDALDVIKIKHGQPTQLPAVDWSRP